MPIDPKSAGAEIGPVEHAWSERDVMLYSLAVGAGTDELHLTTENTRGVTLQVLPTFAAIVGGAGWALRSVGEFDRTGLVHGEQAIEVVTPIPAAGSVQTTARIAGVWDKGSAAVVVVEGRSVDSATGDLRFVTRASYVIRGEGGFGGDRGPSSPLDPVPERDPDHVVAGTTLPQQALIYRLLGDRNPLHSDPSFARAAGFERPILHGLCTYGWAARAVLGALYESDPARLRWIGGRFARPVLPGDTLTTSIWRVGKRQAVFQTTTQGGQVVLDRGRCRFE